MGELISAEFGCLAAIRRLPVRTQDVQCSVQGSIERKFVSTARGCSPPDSLKQPHVSRMLAHVRYQLRDQVSCVRYQSGGACIHCTSFDHDILLSLKFVTIAFCCLQLMLCTCILYVDGGGTAATVTRGILQLTEGVKKLPVLYTVGDVGESN